MIKIWKACIWLGALGLFSSCLKDNSLEPVAPPQTTVPSGYLNNVQWNSGITGYFDYRPDNRLNSIQYNLNTSYSKVLFEWSGDKLTGVNEEASSHKNVYQYGSSGALSVVQNQPKSNSGGFSTYKLEYVYNPDGSLDSLKYYVLNGQTQTLQARSKYLYNGQGLISEIVSEHGPNLIRQLIESWSPEIDFLREMFLESALTENYTIFNYAVLSQADRLPLKITRIIREGSTGTPSTDKIQEYEYTLSGTRITASKATVSFPQVPGGNTSSSGAAYNYEP